MPLFITRYHFIASRCPGMRLSTWQMTAASCPTALDTVYGQPMSRLVSYHERSAAMATEPLQPRDLICGTPFGSSYAIQTSPTDRLDDS